MKSSPKSDAFTLIEVIVVIGIIALLMVVLTPAMRGAINHMQETNGVNNLRHLGVAALRYAYDHDGTFPVRKTDNRRWPSLFMEYLDNDPRYYAEPYSKTNYLTLKVDPTSDKENHTCYLLNAFDELAADAAKINNIDKPSSTILMAPQIYNPKDFVLNVKTKDYQKLINYRRYREGAYYVFADGATRFIPATEYNSGLWLADKSYRVQ